MPESISRRGAFASRCESLAYHTIPLIISVFFLLYASIVVCKHTIVALQQIDILHQLLYNCHLSCSTCPVSVITFSRSSYLFHTWCGWEALPYGTPLRHIATSSKKVSHQQFSTAAYALPFASVEEPNELHDICVQNLQLLCLSTVNIAA